MEHIIRLGNRAQDLMDIVKKFDFLGPLALRLYLAPIFISAGVHKMNNFSDIVAWFEHGLNMPMPELMAFLATSTEIVGGLALVIGIATRWFAVPLLVTMFVAAATAHWDNGWFAIAPGNPETSTAYVLEKVGFPGAKESLENSVEVGNRLGKAKEILREHGNYSWLSGKGTFVILNNGIEFAATYFFMLLVLLGTGGGRYVSVDYWIHQRFRDHQS